MADHPGARASTLRTLPRLLLALILLLTGLTLAAGGTRLMTMGGSWYYLLAGLAYLLLAVLVLRRHRLTAWFSLVVFTATVFWALFDAPRLGYWELLPRLVVPALLLMMTLWSSASYPASAPRARRWRNGGALITFAALLATLVAAFFPHGGISNPVPIAGNPAAAKPSAANPDNWEFFGRNGAGTRFAPYDQITPDNVGQLEVAWTYRTGRRISGDAIGVDENTPLQIGSTLYSCTPENLVTAIDGDTGTAIWKFDPKARTAEHVTCRGVGYYDIDKDSRLDPASKAAYTAPLCRQRILVSSVDARLFALDAHSGSLCPGFGTDGFVDLKPHMGPTEGSKRYHPTSIPVVMGHLAVIGGWVRDIMDGEPSGVVRAFNVIDGSQAWAWDVGKPDDLAQPGQDFELATPNVWTIPTYDHALNLVYLPTGNGPPDYWGGERNAVKEKFGSSVVALDASTGQLRWSQQLVHHDVWDYDVPSQPVLFDVTNAQGQKVPALIQTTKTGHIFVMDRRTGAFVTEVVETPVPQTPHAQGERLSPTQPLSVGMPVIGAEPLTENAMWGVSPFDQLYCRIQFRDSNYQGMFTPPSEQPYIEWPSLLGGMNWGGISIDESRNLMFVNDMRMALRMSLVTREEAKKYKISTDEVPGFMGTVRPQLAGPYGGVKIDILQSPLGVPCPTPPFGTMSAIDLNTKQLVWQVPLGTVRDTGPLGIKTGLPMPVGMPTLGGPTATASGLVFFAGSQDYYLRALDATSGKEVWKARLPVGAVAAPLVYVSPKTGKQYVVISAGGASHSPDLGDYVIAYALPGGR
ncbi:membrane-bound PQQ-dependent dehydrogenase, glucose/quinate/shikimate family [Stenotrophomonas sp. SY1]|uniref:membrane-bound PQQ-dependent dehydrogenase, glucose/quinate/shikimate family n=1 Tax=Stenotrophomonas sp. SY1 TaxID=477235 RepID=UPI001E51BA0A|nr:membrane-bound PQQ-dependent dehydrogenase, glucose/quinate/shikimate family [Stenotrophomonas sp. SY1]MCD9085155.1 membrane-bound PQQ-dependent dehydrogenase, glucose/quinate/shikimate family [Stenotrophomonas sp. SY1]